MAQQESNQGPNVFGEKKIEDLTIEDLAEAIMKYQAIAYEENMRLIAKQAAEEFMKLINEERGTLLGQLKNMDVRRRINRSISTKGIIQYDGTVEASGLTLEEFMAEQAALDLEISRLQPDYEEFVQPLPKE